MRCKTPMLLKTKSSYLIGGVIKVGCGYCALCRLEKSRQWAMRIEHEAQTTEKKCFITLTYSEENVPRSISKEELQNFFKRLRKHGEKIRYFACGEYGENYGRPHYHAIIFGKDYEENRTILDKSWTKGFIHIGNVTYKSAQYVAKYVLKKLTQEYAELYKELCIEPEFCLMSRNPGIGTDYFNKYVKNSKLDFVWTNGKKSGLPKFYKSKLSPEMQEIIKKATLLHIKNQNVSLEERGFVNNEYYEVQEREEAKQLEKNLLWLQNNKELRK